jgi:hypothetical protein
MAGSERNRSGESYQAALRWLVREQGRDGAWDDLVTTALAVLGFVWGGNTDRAGSYRPQVAQARDWLEARIGPAENTPLSSAVWALLELARRSRREEDKERAARHFTRLPGGSVAGRWMLASSAREDPEAACWYVLAHRAAAQIGLPRTGDPAELEAEMLAAKDRLKTLRSRQPDVALESDLARYLRTLRPELLLVEREIPETDAMRHLVLDACLGDPQDAAFRLAAMQARSGREEGSVRCKGVSVALATACAALVFALAA